MESLKLLKALYLDGSWSDKKIDDAARGMVIGSCDDPPSVEAKAFLEIERSRGKSMIAIELYKLGLLMQYLGKS